MTTFAPWTPVRRCTGKAQPGARAMMAAILTEIGPASSLGIYNCRAVRGGSTTSKHGEGRALDVAMPMKGGRGSKAGHRLVQQLRRDADKLGIEAIIYDRRIWSAKSPGKRGRRYNGSAPHYNHIHIELSWNAAKRLSKALVRKLLRGGGGGGGKRKEKTVQVHPFGSRTLRKGMGGTDVAILQYELGVNDDGTFGRGTREVVRDFQREHGFEVDGSWGKSCFKKLAELRGER